MAGPAAERPLRVALLGAGPAERARLCRGLTAAGPLEVVCDCRVSAFGRSLARGCDVLLVDLAGAGDEELDALDRVAGEWAEPMVFVDSGCGDDRLGERVYAKLRAVVAAAGSDAGGASAAPPAAVPAADRGGPAVWVLGASFGGPQMLKRLLGALPAAPSAALLIAQHIGEGFTEVLARQLHRCGPVAVVCAVPGMALRPGRAYVMPVDRRLVLAADGRLAGGPSYPEGSVNLPCIDEVMAMCAARYGARCGAIVLSGMGDDGARGARAVAAAGGPVWVQDAASCAVASMPAAVRAAGIASREGTPEALAAALARSPSPGVAGPGPAPTGVLPA